MSHTDQHGSSSERNLLVRLLGTLDIQTRNRALAKPSYEKGRALLAFLIAEPHSHSREKLAALFWPDLSRNAARNNLRLVLLNLQQCINDCDGLFPYILANRDSLRINPELNQWVDLNHFTGKTSTCESCLSRSGEACPEQLEFMANLYRGDFMEGFLLPDGPEFDDWLYMKREELRRRSAELLRRLSLHYEVAGDYARSLTFSSRYVRQNPWDEEGYRRTMRLHGLNGQVSEALAQYETCVHLLERDLGVEPSEETRRLASLLREGRFGGKERGHMAKTMEAGQPFVLAEWRQVTVVYCRAVEPDAARSDNWIFQLDRFKAHCAAVFQRFTGYVGMPYIGGVFAYFGYPQANEMAARQAVIAALEVVNTARELGIEARAGVHTGLIAIGADQDIPDASGATSAVAASLHVCAASGEVALSAETYQLVARHFECSRALKRRLFGLQDLAEVFVVTRENRFTQGDPAEKIPPLVGRDVELDLLMQLWKATGHKVSNTALVRGEAGIGKSRLVEEVKSLAGTSHPVMIELRCLPEYQNTPFYPLIAALGMHCGFLPEDAPQTKSQKLVQFLDDNRLSADTEISLFTQFLSLPFDGGSDADFSPVQIREATWTFFSSILLRLTARAPALLVVEDLHWADPSTLEFLERFVRSKIQVPVFTILTCRLDFQAQWTRSCTAVIEIGPLGATDAKKLIHHLARRLPPRIIRDIVERADGVPLFIEEKVKIARRTGQLSMPATLLDLLAARLDGLGTDKRTAQLAATIGREFRIDLLQRITSLDPQGLQQSLRRLQDAGLILAGNAPFFRFRHGLVQEVAYQSQSQFVRRRTHHQIATLIKQEFAGIVQTQPELLAHHLTAAEEFIEAILFWHAAGQRAAHSSFNEEAVSHFTAGLHLLHHIGPDKERNRLEFLLWMGLGTGLCAVKGHGSVEAGQAFDRAFKLHTRDEGNSERFRALYGQWRNVSDRPRVHTSRKLPEQLSRIANESGDVLQMQQAFYAIGKNLFSQGKFVEARTQLAEGVALYQSSHLNDFISQYGINPRCISGILLAQVYWLLGFPSQAKAICQQTLVLAREVNHPYSLACSLSLAGMLHCWMRDSAETHLVAEELRPLARRHGFLVWQHTADFFYAWVRHVRHEGDGTARMQRAMHSIREASLGVNSFFFIPLIEAFLSAGKFDAALAVVNEALLELGATGNRAYEAEYLRLHGVCLSQHEGIGADRCFDAAMRLARKQQAASLELRVVLSRMKVREEHGGRGENCKTLVATLGRFTEGFESPDLLEARSVSQLRCADPVFRLVGL